METGKKTIKYNKKINRRKIFSNQLDWKIFICCDMILNLGQLYPDSIYAQKSNGTSLCFLQNTVFPPFVWAQPKNQTALLHRKNNEHCETVFFIIVDRYSVWMNLKFVWNLFSIAFWIQNSFSRISKFGLSSLVQNFEKN